jgi:RHS repeat-associated protein
VASLTINGVLQAEYKYDFAGRQAVRKLPQLGVTLHSVFDSDGRRIAEYNEATGALVREYVWLGWSPVAVIEGGVVSFVRTDHIGRPVFATNAAGTKVWTASYLPFGGVRTTTGTPPTARFPGQWFQSESGLHQNWMRDYDPTTGRYLQADPLGLVDGASVYGYAGQNPGRYADPTGQCFGPAAALLPVCIAAAWMLYDYLSDDCYTWGDFALSLASNFPPFRALRWTRRGGGTGGGNGGRGGDGPGAGNGGDGPSASSGGDGSSNGGRGGDDGNRTPGDNQRQNRDFDAAVRDIERAIGGRLSKKDRRRLHEEITGRGYGFHDIVQSGLDLFK